MEQYNNLLFYLYINSQIVNSCFQQKLVDPFVQRRDTKNEIDAYGILDSFKILTFTGKPPKLW